MTEMPTADAMSRRRARLWAAPLAVLSTLALIWVAGLVWFASSIPSIDESEPESTDAIVVLTGGSQRLQSGLQLLAEGRAKKLFVSGVYRGTDVSALLHAAPPNETALQCCIELGHQAGNTVGNAVETSQWMSREHYRSLRLVTANYHMRRALLEFSRAMPGIHIVPHPVFPEAVRRGQWWARPNTLELIVGEYDKYLIALVRPLIPFDIEREEAFE